MKNDIIKSRVTPEQKQFIDYLCESTGLTVSQIIRYLIDEKIKTIKD